MRGIIFVATAVVITTSASAADPTAGSLPEVHRLDSPAALAELRRTNPNHYARAEQLIAAANVLCEPGAPQVQSVQTDARCQEVLLKTSNPPKREITFTLDHIRYAALVIISADIPKVIQAISAPPTAQPGK